MFTCKPRFRLQYATVSLSSMCCQRGPHSSLYDVQVFGKLMVCKDMDTAVRLSTQASHISFVTIQGDQVNKKGTMTGGYIDKTRYNSYCTTLHGSLDLSMLTMLSVPETSHHLQGA